MSAAARLALVALAASAALSCRDEVAIEARPPLPPDAGVTDAAREATPIPTNFQGIPLATFNVHRFFDTQCDSGSCGPGDYEELPSRTTFEDKARALAEGITKLQAEVVVLQEVESQACLDALGAKLPALPHRHLGETGSPASVDVALLSAHPITSVKGHASSPIARPNGEPTTFARELLEVHLATPEGELVVFAAHFRSKVNDDPDRRWAEARAARSIVLDEAARSPGAIVVLAGDLNDVPGSPPLEALLEGGSIVSAAAGRAPWEIGTYPYGGGLLAIDHVLVAARAPGRAVPESFQVFREAKSGWAGSDHGAVRVHLTR
jgi:endonuclease/exonuclease/phosphatase family metal-dependent hydrolase